MLPRELFAARTTAQQIGLSKSANWGTAARAAPLLISLHFHLIFACLEWPCPSSSGERYLLWREPSLSFLVRSRPSFVSPGDGPCEHPQRGKQSDRRPGLRRLGLPGREIDFIGSSQNRWCARNERLARQQNACSSCVWADSLERRAHDVA